MQKKEKKEDSISNYSVFLQFKSRYKKCNYKINFLAVKYTTCNYSFFKTKA